MNLASSKTLKSLLKKHNIHPLKKLGQNFLINKTIVKKIIKTANPQPEDTVLEIGPGIGVLTQELAKKAKKVIAIEKDSKMIELLKETLKDFKNIEIVNEDILKYQVKIKSYKIVGSLPFYLGAPVIRKFLENRYQPKEMVLLIQKEVAQKIVAKPPRMNLLAVSVQFFALPKIISYVSKKSFWPKPKVDGAIIKIIPKNPLELPLKTSERPLFFKIIRAGFSHPRKQLINNLTKGLKVEREKIKNWLLKNKISPIQRAETLNVKDWIKLTKSFKIR